ncbi:toll/interleukin-1 receptor domain-containing protein [Sphingobacterium multivorum]|uniref:toll/interleukin-1 receptor domain-containing protein n=1 Tax=Sphingobacterium multivorum TaxID=28454 RepID=UPI0028A283F8|nr:SEFIR domain-containing protein [Sphingobacterium multivorum]
MNKKVFISYAWGNSEHQEWVVNLATRLMNDTVDVVLDRWSLKDGHDIHSFMEEMVKAEDIFRVLIISDKKYSEKANDREGGVGTETQIITPNIYSKEKQDKFIPIVKERDEDGNSYLPVYLQSRKYIDLSREEDFENNYEELLRNILEAPSLPKPKLGTRAPAYITDSPVNLSETHNKIKTITNQILKNGKVPYKELRSFVETFQEKLWDFEMVNSPSDLISYGEKLYDTLKSYKPLKEDFVQFVNLISANDLDNSDELLIDFFEMLPLYQSPRENTGSWVQSRFEIFKIIFHELFLYTIAVIIKNKNYKLAADLLHSKYYRKEKYERKVTASNFTYIYSYHQNLDEYFSQKFNKITGFGEYVIINLTEDIKRTDIILADMICYFVSYLESIDYEYWFPFTYVYGENHSINFFDKISSKRHFDSVKEILGVDTSNDLKEKLIANKNKNEDRIRYGRNVFSKIPFIYELVDPYTIAIHR